VSRKRLLGGLVSVKMEAAAVQGKRVGLQELQDVIMR
jgi:hypothetical protein